MLYKKSKFGTEKDLNIDLESRFTFSSSTKEFTQDLENAEYF